MKRLFVLLAAIFILTVSAAFGEVQDFGNFTIDVPEGWTAVPLGTTAGIIKSDRTASISITVESMKGATLRDFAEAYIKALHGTNLTAEENGYSFEAANESGIGIKCFLSGDGINYALIVITGLESAPQEISAIIGSMKGK